MRLAVSNDRRRYSLCRTTREWLLKYPERDGITASRIIKGVLSEQDIISAPMASMMTRSQLDRYVGGGFMSQLMTGIRKAAPSLLKAAQEGVKGFKEGGAMGCGPSGGAMGCGPSAGGGTGGRRGAKGLSARLM